MRAQLPSTTLVLALLLGCSAGETSGPALKDWTFTGTWRGGFVNQSFTLSTVLHLTELDSALVGDGVISGSGLECGVNVDGSRNGEQVALDLTCPGYAPIRYRGARTGATRIEGVVSGSGLPQSAMALVKQ